MKSLLLICIIANLSFTASAQEKRSKSINFDDELIEGINRKPLDAFNQISESNAQNRNHLYKKRASFQDRNKVLLEELR